MPDKPIDVKPGFLDSMKDSWNDIRVNHPGRAQALVRSLQWGGIGAGIGGLALGGLAATGDTGDDEDRGARIRRQALLGALLGASGGTSAAWAPYLTNSDAHGEPGMWGKIMDWGTHKVTGNIPASVGAGFGGWRAYKSFPTESRMRQMLGTARLTKNLDLEQELTKGLKGFHVGNVRLRDSTRAAGKVIDSAKPTAAQANSWGGLAPVANKVNQLAARLRMMIATHTDSRGVVGNAMRSPSGPGGAIMNTEPVLQQLRPGGNVNIVGDSPAQLANSAFHARDLIRRPYNTAMRETTFSIPALGRLGNAGLNIGAGVLAGSAMQALVTPPDNYGN